MTIKCCHRCLKNFKTQIRLIIHLIKDKKCNIINDKYDVTYEKLIMTKVNKLMSTFESDLKIYLVKEGQVYKCKLCDYKSLDKHQIKRHLITTCLSQKYALDQSLIDLLSYSKNPDKCPLYKKSEINYTLSNFAPYIDMIEYDNFIKYECKFCKSTHDNKTDIYLHLDMKHQEQLQTHIDEEKYKALEIKMNQALEVKMNQVLEAKMNQVLETKMKNIDGKFNQIQSDNQKMNGKLNEIVSNNQSMSEEIKNIKPNINHNNINVYLHDNGNSLQLLNQMTGDFTEAIEFIRDCALSEITGDVKLIESIYMQPGHEAVFYVDNKKQKLASKGPDGKVTFDTKPIIARKLANSIQNGYLYGINYLVKADHDHGQLEDYDQYAWNQHIYKLNDPKYQKSLLHKADIPIKKAKLVKCYD